MDTRTLQNLLNNAGYDSGPVDGEFGPRTQAAIILFQKENELVADGKVGPKTSAALLSAKVKHSTILARKNSESIISTAGGEQWPKQSEVSRFFGPHGGPLCTAGKCRLPASMRIAWNLDQRISTFSCHEKVAEPLEKIFQETLKHYGEDTWRDLRLDIWAGCFAVRPMRGGVNYSMHSWGIAVDIDSANNQLKWKKPRASLSGDKYVPFWNIVESTGAVSLGRARDFDWMHFQFARL